MAADESEDLVLKLVVEIRGRIDALDTKLTSRLDAIDAKLDVFTLRVDALEARMARLDDNVARLSASIEYVIRNLRVLATHDPERLDKLEQRVAALERAVGGGSSRG